MTTTATTAATTLRRRLSLAAAAVCLPLSIGVAIAQAPTQAEISAPATSASVTTNAPNSSSSAKLLSIRDIYDRVDAAGYRQVREIDLDHGRYEVKALNPQGQSVKLYVNARSGAIEQVRHRSND